MSYFNHSVRNLLTKIWIALVALGMGLFIPALIGPDLFGVYSFVTVWIAFFIPFCSFGFGAGIVYQLSKKEYRIEQISTTNLFAALLAGFLNMICLFIAFRFGFFNKVFETLSVFHLSILLLSSFLQTLSFFMGRSLLGLSHFLQLNIINGVSSLLNPILLIVMAYTVGTINYDFIFYSLLLFSIFVFLIHLFYLAKFFKFRSPDKVYAISTSVYGMKSWLGDMALRANLRFDQLLLGVFSNAASLGIYSLGVKLSEIIWYISDSVGPVLFNALAGIKEQNEQLKLLYRVHRILFSFCLLFAAIWLGAVQFIIIPFIFPSGFEGLMLVFLFLLPGTVFLVSSKMITKLLSSTGRVWDTTVISLMGTVVCILLYFLLIPVFGEQGAAAASSLGYMAMSIAALVILKKKYPVRFKEFFIPAIEDYYWLKDKWTYLIRQKNFHEGK